MQITKSIDGYKLCVTPKELAQLNILNFFLRLFSNKSLINELYDSPRVKEFISELATKSIDSKEYEYYSALIDLYYAFEKKCDFCFKLKSSFDPNKHQIKTIDDIERYKDDPPDVIVKHKDFEYPFELKRYRGEISYDALYNFIKTKIIDHYSGKQNFLIILQPNNGSNIDLSIFKQIHKKLETEKNKPGYIGLTFNHDNFEMITIRVSPTLNQYKRPYNTENDLFIDLL